MNWTNIELINEYDRAFVYEIELVKDGSIFKYIGYKTINGNWRDYIGSSKYVLADKEFIVKKTILKTFSHAQDAYIYEISLINELDAVNSQLYYNRTNYTG